MALTKIPSELSSTTGIVDNSNATAITIDSSENVGIGTSSPSQKLHISDSAPFARLESTSTSYNGFTTKNDSGNFYFGIDDSGGNFYGSAYARAIYADGAYPVTFYTNGAERMRIDSSGRVTVPSQPTFNAYRNTATITFTSPASFLCNATRHNVGNHFSTSTGRFTAPVAGIYHFTFHTIFFNAISNGSMYLLKNGSALAGTHTHFSQAENSVWNTVRIATTIALNANDYVEPYNGGSSTAIYHGQSWNAFAGYLLG